MAWETSEMLRKWCDEGRAQKKAIMLLCCDRFDYEQYPVYVSTDDEFWFEYDRHNGLNMQSVDCVFDLSQGGLTTLPPDRYPKREEVLTFTYKIAKKHAVHGCMPSVALDLETMTLKDVKPI